jgi:hypothetical protein
MASTRNKNTIGNYEAEQRSIEEQWQNISYTQFNIPLQTYHAGDGLLVGKVGPMQLADNYTDIESDLRGIGSTNLVTPKYRTVPEMKSVKSLSIIDRLPVFLPTELVVQPNQRQRLL